MTGDAAGIRRWTWLGFTAGLLAIAGILGLASRRSVLSGELPAIIVERHQLRDALAATAATVTEAESAAGAYLVTGDPTHLRQFEDARDRLSAPASRLAEMPSLAMQGVDLATVDSLVAVHLEMLQRSVALRRDSDLAGAAAVVSAGHADRTMPRLRQALDLLQGKALARLAGRETRLLAQIRTSERLIALGSGLALLLLLAAAYLVHRGTDRLDRATHQLRLSEERLRLITANVQETVVAFDTELRLMFVNPAFEALTGDPVAALEERTLASYCHPDDLPGLRPLWQQVLAGQSFNGQELRVIRRDGSIRWCTSSWGPARDERGGLLGVVGLILDITARTEAEAQLRSDADLLAAIAESQQRIATTTPDLQAVMTSIAEHAVALTGADGAGVAMVEGEELVYRVTSGSVSRHINMRLKLQGSLAGLAVRTGDILRCDDTESDDRVDREATRRAGIGSMLVVPLLYDGRAVGALTVVAVARNAFAAGHVRSMSLLAGLMAASLSHASVFHDTSLRLARSTAALEESEDRFRRIVETAQEGIWLLDEKGVTRYGNRRLAQMLGCAPSQLPGRPVTDFIPTPDRSLAAERFRPASARTDRGDVEFRRTNGEIFWAMVSTSPVETSDGAAVGTLAMVTDVTARRATEETLRRHAHRLQLLRELDQRILAAGSVTELAETALSQVQQLVPCDRANLVLFDLDAGTATIVAEHGSTTLPARRNRRIPLGDLSPAEVLQRGPVRTIPDLALVRERPRVLEALLASGVRSVLTVPLVGGQELLGEVNLSALQPAAFSAEHEEIAREVAAQIAIALQQARLRERLGTAPRA